MLNRAVKFFHDMLVFPKNKPRLQPRIISEIIGSPFG